MAYVEACDPAKDLGSVYASRKGKDTQTSLVPLPSEILPETDARIASKHLKPMMSNSSDLKNTAEEILKYTGLSGGRLRRRMREFTDCNRGTIYIIIA